MISPYPIVDQRSLEPSPRRGRLGLGRRHREPAEIPTVHAHQVLVYRVNGEYILDRVSRDLGHEQVLAATHVSLVDIRQNYPVVVEFDIPSAEASEFRVSVTFACTVDDPVQVVRAGTYAASEMLAGHLKRHHRIFELGLERTMAQLNEVRRDVRAEVTAYTTVRPPIFSGMSVTMTHAEVRTPEELVDFEKTRRGQRFSHTIASERQHYEHELRHGGLHQEAQRERDRLMYERDREYEQQRHEAFISLERQRSEQLRDYERREFQRRELIKAEELLGEDPQQALRLAFASGELRAAELAAELQAGRDRAAQTEEARKEREREDRMRSKQWAHEERQERNAAQRAMELQKALWSREDLLRSEEEGRADKQKLFETNLEVLREFGKMGHLDLVNIDLNRLVAELTGQRPEEKATPAVDAAGTPQLPKGGQEAAAGPPRLPKGGEDSASGAPKLSDGGEDAAAGMDMRDEDGD